MFLQRLVAQYFDLIPKPHVLYWVGKIVQISVEIFILVLCKFFHQQVKQGGELLYYMDTALEKSPFEFRFKDWIAKITINEISYQKASKEEIEKAQLEANVQWSRMTESFWKVCMFRVTKIPVFAYTVCSLLLVWIWYIDEIVKYGMLRASPDALVLLEAGYLKAFVAAPMHPTTWLLSENVKAR